MEVILDIETDGLLENVSRIHCLSYQVLGQDEIRSLTNTQDIKNFLLQDNLTIIGHNIIRYDIPVLEKLLQIKINSKLIDTLALSWYLYPDRDKHGLEQWGEDLGVAKPVISDWNNLKVEDYIHRCESDVKINKLLFDKQQTYLINIYGKNRPFIIDYLSFKLDCAREQEEIKWKLDVDLCKETLAEFEALKEEKKNNLIKVMPRVPVVKVYKKPSKILNKKGELTSLAKKWFNLLNEQNLSYDREEPVEIVVNTLPGNPNSTNQKKDWLFSLGWVPRTFDYVKNKDTGEEREVPQIYNDDKEVCDSIKELYPVCPELENLDSLSLLSHRIGILKGFLKNVDEDGFLKAEIKGLTNTLRFQHTTIVNLPKISKPFSANIRACLIAPDENHTLCGSDMSSLEDNTKKHYMWKYDPNYVTEMSKPGYDPHLGVGVFAGLITQEEADFFKLISKKLDNKEEVSSEEIIRYKAIGVKRSLSKTVNFAGVYGAGPPKIAKSSGMPLDKAYSLHKAYWDLNWSVKQIAKDTRHKIVDGKMWLYNPVSGFYYSLRYEKDKFSTLNQGTGVYCFDNYVREVRQMGYKICGQFHDEIIFPLQIGNEERVKQDLLKCIDNVNDKLKLNVKLGISIQFDRRYSEIH